MAPFMITQIGIPYVFSSRSRLLYCKIKFVLWCPTSKGQLFFDVVFGMNQVVHFTDNDICEVGLV